MNLETTRTDASATIVVTGAMDAEHAYDAYQAAAAEAQAGSSTITFDLAGVDFIDSVGLGMLIRTRDELSHDFESRLVLRAPSPYVTRLLELTGLQGQFRTSG